MGADLTQTNGTGLPADGLNRFVVLKNEAVSLVGAAAAEVIVALNIPAGFMVLGAAVKIVTACDVASSKIDVGLVGGSTGGFIYDVAADGAAGTVTKSTGTANENYCQVSETTSGTFGYLATAADTIDVTVRTMGSTAAAGVFALYVWGVQVYE